ncbi:MAG: YeeE/YedE family protein [Thermoflavifilum sp.]|nr:YeeE/YedE family protein [Thermoflavifilum sp.]
MIDFLRHPWPWYVAGPLIGLTVPLLLLLGNKRLGISSTFRQICAACVPGRISFLRYDWKKQSWNLYFVAGIFLGGFLAGHVLANPEPVQVSAHMRELLQQWHIHMGAGLLPEQWFNWHQLLSWQGILLTVVGGFLVGFGTRYGEGCTSGHGIFGLSSLQWPSLIATMAFFAGGILSAHLIVPLLFK